MTTTATVTLPRSTFREDTLGVASADLVMPFLPGQFVAVKVLHTNKDLMAVTLYFTTDCLTWQDMVRAVAAIVRAWWRQENPYGK